MKSTASPSSHPMRARILWLLITVLVIGLRLLIPPRGMDDKGLIAILDSSISVAFWLLIMSITAGLGLLVLRAFSLPRLSIAERLTIALALGLGTLSYLLVGMGLIGALEKTTILILIVIIAFTVGPYVLIVWNLLSLAPKRVSTWWQNASALHRSILVLALVITAVVFIQALSPPTDYDGRMYHLPGPRLFLEQKAIVPVFSNWYVNGPFTVEMFFTIGLAVGDDIFPKLIHLMTGWIYVIATFVFARRWLTSNDAFLSAAVLIGMPTIPLWAAFAHIDLAWASFEFLALSVVILGWRTRDHRFLMLGGLLSGLAMGSKYLGLAGFAVLGTFVALSRIRSGWKSFFVGTAIYALPAILVALPWYLKNYILFGNPVYPLVFGGLEWDPTRLELYMGYVQSFGTGRSLVDYLLIPWNIYVKNTQFGTGMNRIDIPSVLFPLLLFYPLVKKKSRIVSIALLLAGAQFALWTVGSQQTRFLLPIFPTLAIGTAFVANRILSWTKGRIPWKIFFPTLSVGLMILSLYYQCVASFGCALHRPILGQESRREFLTRILRDFPATDYINNKLPPTSSTLLISDGAAYYCPDKCVPDPDHFRWAREILDAAENEELATWFTQNGFTHLLLNLEDLEFLLQHDPFDVIRGAIITIEEWRNQGCLEVVFEDDWTRLLEVTCQ